MRKIHLYRAQHLLSSFKNACKNHCSSLTIVTHLFVYFFILLAETTNPSSDFSQCRTSIVHNDVTLVGGIHAGKFTDLGDAENMGACSERCCLKDACDVAFMLEEECYGVSCVNESMCEMRPARNPSRYNPKLAYVHHEKAKDTGMKQLLYWAKFDVCGECFVFSIFFFACGLEECKKVIKIKVKNSHVEFPSPLFLSLTSDRSLAANTFTVPFMFQNFTFQVCCKVTESRQTQLPFRPRTG